MAQTAAKVAVMAVAAVAVVVVAVMVVMVVVVAAMGDHSAHHTGRSSHCERSVGRQDITFRKPSGCHQGMPAMVVMVAVAALGSGEGNVFGTVPRNPGGQLEGKRGTTRRTSQVIHRDIQATEEVAKVKGPVAQDRAKLQQTFSTVPAQ